ncbi:MAG TPA: FecR family protein [Candidatus Acidoferrales bacterium]|nr:FecR family protein [Candidatus Acidoferrales bacterium]
MAACAGLLVLLACGFAAAQNPLDILKKDAAAEETKVKTEALTKSMGSILDNQLPLTLDANSTYPTVATLPGRPFHPLALTLNAAQLDQPQPPGDYIIQIFAYCTEYSVHRPGAGTAYELAPIQGKAAGAITNLLWRGNLQGRPPQQLQAVSWAIQSGLRYSQMPKMYQTVIDGVIPDYKNQLDGDFFSNLQDSYASMSKGTKLPPLDTLLAGMGKSGQLALSAERQRAALQRANTTDQIREQVLFQGQDTGVIMPTKAQNGPWTVRVPNQVYMRYTIVGGNMAGNNTMEIRIVPAATTAAASKIGYPVGTGAQDLVPVPVLTQTGCMSGTSAKTGQVCVGSVMQASGSVTVKHPDGSTSQLNVGDTVGMNDTIQTGPNSRANVLFQDETTLTVSENSKLLVDNYVYDPYNSSSNRALYSYLEGAFQYVSGLIGKKADPDVNIETPVGTIGIRGTEFIFRTDATKGMSELDLIDGSVSFGSTASSAGTTYTAPVTVVFAAGSARTAALTQAQYNAIKAQVAAGRTPALTNIP